MTRQYLIVDDHPIVHQAMGDALRALDPECAVGTAEHLDHAMRALRDGAPYTLVLFDLKLPDASGVDGLAEIRRQYPGSPVAVFSAHVEQPTIVRCLELGACGYIPKTHSPDAIRSALRLITSGCPYVPPQALATENPIRPRPDPHATRGSDPRSLGLTERQIDVLDLILKGLPNKLICRRLSLAEGTVKVHVSAVLRALGARNRTQAVIAASRIGLKLPDGS